jgi:Fe-S oxidoreductase
MSTSPPAPPDAHAAELCALCPKLCRFACPVTAALGDEAATPTAMMQAWREARAGRRPWSGLGEALSACTGCEACRPPCEFGQDVPALLYRARAEAWEHAGAADFDRSLLDRHLTHGNPFGADMKQILSEYARDEDLHPKGRVLYWPGCRQLARDGGRLPAEMRLLHALGAAHVSLPARDDVPACCGAPLLAIGDSAGFAVAAAGLQQYFNRQRTWVSGCSSCLHAVRAGWQAIGIELRAEVLHIAEYLAFFKARITELAGVKTSHLTLGDGPESPGSPAGAAPSGGAVLAATAERATVFVHDSCGLHRRLGRGSAVHDVVEAATGQRPRSLGPSADRSPCCGAGDFFDQRRPADAARVAAHGIAEISPQGGFPDASWIVTGDSACLDSLRGALPGCRVDDLMGFLLAYLAPALAEQPADPFPLQESRAGERGGRAPPV